MIATQLLLHSANPDGQEITTWLLTYPRIIHAEFMTHRVFSRNASSSRAIPIQKMCAAVEDNPAQFEYWGGNKAGMQAGAELQADELALAQHRWLQGAKDAVKLAQALSESGLHKQNANRVLEPWSHITVIATATSLGNFFALRAHPAAQPEFQTLAYRMLSAYLHSAPEIKAWGEWHIPFGDRMPAGLSEADRIRVATARCARTSYLTFDNEIDVAKDIALHDQLATAGHWSPFEHCARADDAGHDTGNFKGWLPYRKCFGTENRRLTREELYRILSTKPAWLKIAP